MSFTQRLRSRLFLVTALCLFICSTVIYIWLFNGPGQRELASVFSSSGQVRLKNVLVYYGWPSSLNSFKFRWDKDRVVKFLNQYDVVVMPGGVEDPGHGDHANSFYIFKNMKSSVELFGYIAIGYTNSFSIEEIKNKIDLWKKMNVDGIFLDEAGFDYWSSDIEMRKRQNESINYAHAKGLRVFLNAWNPDDLFVKQSRNPLKIDHNDYALLESYIFSFARPLDFNAYKKNIKGFKYGKERFGIQLVGLSTTKEHERDFRQSDFDFMVHAAQLDGLDGVGWGTANFSATSAKVTYRKIKKEYERLEMSNTPTHYNVERRIVSKKLKNSTLYLDYNDFSFESRQQ